MMRVVRIKELNSGVALTELSKQLSDVWPTTTASFHRIYAWTMSVSVR